MYESFFGLNRRPFAAAPDEKFYFEATSQAETLRELAQCVRMGQGIGVLTAAEGVGKTSFCLHLAESLRSDFTPILIPSGNLPGVRPLLQTLLFELRRPYAGFDDHELRLQVQTVSEEVAAAGRPLVIIVDEAHLLHEDALEGLRLISAYSRDGQDFCRLVLCGGLELDETLAEPQLKDFVQRIGCQGVLEPLTRSECQEYIQHRIEVAANQPLELFSPDARLLIAEAADGVPRNINQLCDHSLLLAFAAEAKPVDATLVRDALDDLKQLPLHWGEVQNFRDAQSPVEDNRPDNRAESCEDSASPTSNRQSEVRFLVDDHVWGRYESTPVDSEEPVADSERPILDGDRTEDDRTDEPAAVWEVGAELDTPPADVSGEFGAAGSDDSAFRQRDDWTPSLRESEDWATEHNLAERSQVPATDHMDKAVFESSDMIRQPEDPSRSSSTPVASRQWDEEVVLDPYAALDAGKRLTQQQLLQAREQERKQQDAAAMSHPQSAEERPAVDTTSSQTARFDVGEYPVDKPMADIEEFLRESMFEGIASTSDSVVDQVHSDFADPRPDQRIDELTPLFEQLEAIQTGDYGDDASPVDSVGSDRSVPHDSDGDRRGQLGYATSNAEAALVYETLQSADDPETNIGETVLDLCLDAQQEVANRLLEQNFGSEEEATGVQRPVEIDDDVLFGTGWAMPEEGYDIVEPDEPPVSRQEFSEPRPQTEPAKQPQRNVKHSPIQGPRPPQREGCSKLFSRLRRREQGG